MFNRLESRLSRLRRASHLDAQMSKFATLQRYGLKSQFIEWCVHTFETLGKCKIEDIQELDTGFVFVGTREQNIRGSGKVEKPIRIELIFSGLTFLWEVFSDKSGDSSLYKGKNTYSTFTLAGVPGDVMRPIMMGKF